MKAKCKKNLNPTLTTYKENETKSISSNNFILSNTHSITQTYKKANSSTNISKSINHAINPTIPLSISNNIHLKTHNDKVLPNIKNNKIIKHFVKEENINSNNKIKNIKTESESSKSLNLVVGKRRDSQGNIIYKGSKMHHIIFKDCLEIKKPLVEIINVESYKKENINEFLTEDYRELEDSSDKYSSNACDIF